jgi:hypothetical protein
MASFGRYQNAQIQNALGQALAGVEVFFLTQPADVDALTPLATVFSNSTGAGGAITQPLITDGLGQYAAYLSPGVYTVVYVIPTAGIFSYPDQNIAIGGGTPGSVTFDQIGTGFNSTATMGASLGCVIAPTVGNPGLIQATQVGTAGNGVVITGVPGVGQVLQATSPTAATWQTPSGAGVTSLNTLTGALTLAAGPGLSISISGSTITISAAVAFVINSFTGGRTVELGFAVVNPAFMATYSTTPLSAFITNTDNINSPFTLTTPFTNAAITGSFSHSTVTTTTFTLNAANGTTQTAQQQITWQPAIFAGLGSAGATSTVTAAGTTAVLSTGDALPRTQLGAEVVGETFGPFTASAQVLYLLLTGGSHTFIDANTGFPFAFNAPISVSFVNANGTSVPMFLYASTNVLTGSFAPRITS